MIKKINRCSIVGILTMIVYLGLLFVDKEGIPAYDFMSGLMIGISLGSIIVSAIYTTKYGAKIRAFKLRMLSKSK